MIKYILCVAFAISSVTLQAQELSKKEKKELKKEIKALLKNPENYIALKEVSENKTKIINKQTDDMLALKKEYGNNLVTMKGKNDSLKNELGKLNAEENNYANMGSSRYSVQIGAYKNFDISAILDNKVTVSYGYLNGLYKYYIGNFSSLEDASFFAEQFRNLGIEGAFVTEDLRDLTKPVAKKEVVKPAKYSTPSVSSTQDNKIEPAKITPKKNNSNAVIYMD